MTLPANRLTALTASLPMYDLPELRETTDALWLALASRLWARGIPAPAALSRDETPLEAQWRDPALLLSQTCGYPLVTALKDEVLVVGTPEYRAAGCDGAFHRSAIVVRAGSAATALGDLQGQRCAVNLQTSNTGMNLLRAEISILAQGGAFFSEVIETGSHAASLERVAEGRADLAAIDGVTLALLQRHRPWLTKAVRVLVWTVRTPGLPLITSARRPEWIRLVWPQVLAEIIADPGLRAVREALMLAGFAPLRQAHYRSILHLAEIAASGGYPELR